MSADGSSQAAMVPAGLAEHPVYAIKRELGRGGMGVVYLAENRLMGRYEVLKLIGHQRTERAALLERFHREIRAVAKLRHPNIVTAYHADRLGESIVFAMEYVEGLDLSRLVKARGPLPVAHACSYIHQAALALEHAHEQGMVHRDIKPSNLMLARQGNRATIKILDFGLAKVKSEGLEDGGLTHDGQLLGTPQYVAPEQTVDPRSADIRADIYSLGCTLYFLLAGRPPFVASNLYELLQAHQSMEATPLHLVRPDEVPVELAVIVATMMAKDPKQRFQTPREVAQALKRYFKAGSERIVVEKPENPERGGRVEPSRRMARWLWPSAAGAAGVAALMTVLWAVFTWMTTRDGFLIIEHIPANAVVEVDGARVSVERTGGDVVTAHVRPGKRTVVVKDGGQRLVNERVSIQSGKAFVLLVNLARPAPSTTVAQRASSVHDVVSGGTKPAGSQKTEHVVTRPGIGPAERRPELAAAPGAVAATGSQIVESASRAQVEPPGRSDPPRDGFVELFNGRDLAGWNRHPANAYAWTVENGTIVSRGSRQGHLLSPSGEYASFQVRIQVQLVGEGSVGFCLRTPLIDAGEYGGGGLELELATNGPSSKAARYMESGRWGAARKVVVPMNEWVWIEAIAVGRRILIKVNDQITVDLYDLDGKYDRGHFALHHVNRSTEARFRRLDVRSVDLGNDPALIARGEQPRSLAAESINRKRYTVFTKVMPWEEARIRCAELGGRLALPIDEQENRFLTGLAAKHAEVVGVWLGARDRDFLYQWKSLDGSDLRYSNWDQELIEPRLDLTQQYHPLLLVGRDGKWSDEPNISARYRTALICQWD